MRRLLAVAVLLIATDIPAAQTRVLFDGKPVEGAEVCFFKAGGLLPASEVTCRAASEGAPKGEWAIFARQGEAFVSDRISDVSADVTVVRAAKISGGVSLVYVPRTRSLLPVRDGVIPAETDVVPLSVASGKIAAFGSPVNARPGETAAATFFAPHNGRVHVVAIVTAAAGSDSGVAPPSVTIRSGERVQKPIDPLRATDAKPALLFFPDTLVNGSRLVLSGSRWKSIEAAITAKAPVVTLDPLIATQTSNVEVSWWTPIDLGALSQSTGDCTTSKATMLFEKPTTEKEFVAILEACREPRGSCTEAARRQLPTGALRGSVTFEDVAAGAYVLGFHYPGLPPIEISVDVLTRDKTHVDAMLRYVTFFGKVTRGGKPLHARVFGAVTDPNTGAYNAAVTKLPHAGNPTDVLPCDGSAPYRFVPEDAPKENAAFDIEVPDNRIMIEVHDRETGAPVGGANIGMSALMAGDTDRAHFAGIAGTADADGKITLGPVLDNRRIRICADREDYERECAPDFEMAGLSEKSVRLDLKRVQIRQGRVEGGAGRFGWVIWFSPQTGTLTEMIRSFKDDGSFTYKKEHAPGEIVVVSAADRPLYAFLQPALERDALFDIVRPPVTVRTFTVALAETSNERQGAWPALLIGDVIVPVNALNWHLAPRFHALAPLRPGRSVVISDILQTGAIKVILVTEAGALRHSPQVELPLVPEFRVFPRQDLGTADTIVFP